MRLIYVGKTKDVYDNGDGNYLLKFKDDVTQSDGVFDPGANQTGLKIEGMGKGGILLTQFFFEKIQEAGYPTHYVSANPEDNSMIVKPATMFGKGIEIICRYKAVGSFIRRYGAYAHEGQALDAYVEVTLKDDEREDPLINKSALDMLGILTAKEYDVLEQLTKNISGIVKDELAKKGIELYDIKLEFGRCNGQIVLIDEISGGNMRAFKDGKSVEPLELVHLMCD
jgi:phosphoribosylaminoimidazole-succinocarboxamide synthase